MNHLRRNTLLALGILLLCWPAVIAARGRGGDGTAERIRVLRAGLAHIGYTSSIEGKDRLLWLGTGFIVDRRCTVATAKHILRDAPVERLTVRLENPEQAYSALTFVARVDWVDPDRDLAFLAIAELPGGGNPCAGTRLQPLPLVTDLDPEEYAGAEILILGFPVLEGEQPREIPIVRHGTVASAELTWGGKPMLLLDLTGVPGFSGAPVALRETGEVIGVVFGPGRTERQYDLEWATPLTRRVLKRAVRDD